NVEMQAKVTEAEAEVPKAIAESFRAGNLGIMDYYRMENVKSDTSMRESIANSDADKKDKPRDKKYLYSPWKSFSPRAICYAPLLLLFFLMSSSTKVGVSMTASSSARIF